MIRHPAAILAKNAIMSPGQRVFRAASPAILTFALPLAVWLDHHWSVLPSQKSNPVADQRGERWFDFLQVVQRGVNPRSKRRVTMVGGGIMSKVGNKR